MSRRLLRAIGGTVVSFGLAAVAWEAFARSGFWPSAITPPLLDIGRAVGTMVVNGTMFVHVGFTLFRILVGLGLAVVAGVPLGDRKSVV